MMASHVALLRGINVAGHNSVAMADLRELFENLGFTGVTSLLQSGNFVFQDGSSTTGDLELQLEKETAERLGISIGYMVRSAAEWQKAIERNPYPDEAANDPG